MFELFRDPKIDFLGKTKLCVSISIALCVVAVGVLATRGLSRGIEFTGGSEVQVKYGARPEVAAIRAQLSRAGLANHVVTTIGDPQEYEVYIRVALTSDREESELTDKVRSALQPADEAKNVAAGLFNLNTASENEIENRIAAIPGVTSDAAAALAAASIERRKDRAIFNSVQDLSSVEGMTPEILKALESQSFVGSFAVRSQSYIGPVIGAELVRKAVWAILLSLAGMLVYIGFRFEFQWGAAAVVATVHDTVICLGLFSLFGFEMTLPVVAAFLTLIGYSVNDTVVVFDRIRENRTLRTGLELGPLVNRSINQTLSRTVLTSGLTWLVCVSLFLFGGPALRDFAFVLTAGIIVGTYSSIYVAAPIIVAWHDRLARNKGETAAPVATRGPAKKAKAGRG